ncbi:hypothetical protein MRB53_036263 [Persea americana]|nr:hypothetical protein MRB53_036441 [Persea americana]KAJ8614850.1 hypothetical protein MRB53_036263 [Persea americana]
MLLRMFLRMLMRMCLLYHTLEVKLNSFALGHCINKGKGGGWGRKYLLLELRYSFAQLREASRYATYTFLWARSDLERKGLKASQGRQQLSPFPGEGRLVNSALRRSDSGQLRFDFFMS